MGERVKICDENLRRYSIPDTTIAVESTMHKFAANFRGKSATRTIQMEACRQQVERHSKKIPTDPWNIPQTLNHLFLKEILSYWYFRVPFGYVPFGVGVCWNFLRVIEFLLTLMLRAIGNCRRPTTLAQPTHNVRHRHSSSVSAPRSRSKQLFSFVQHLCCALFGSAPFDQRSVLWRLQLIRQLPFLRSLPGYEQNRIHPAATHCNNKGRISAQIRAFREVGYMVYIHKQNETTI